MDNGQWKMDNGMLAMDKSKSERKMSFFMAVPLLSLASRSKLLTQRSKICHSEGAKRLKNLNGASGLDSSLRSE